MQFSGLKFFFLSLFEHQICVSLVTSNMIKNIELEINSLSQPLSP
jgi:hypothetical protein